MAPEVNQDQFLIADLIKSMLVSATTLELGERVFGHVQGEILLVADGMGGHAAGEQASRLVISHLVHRLLNSVHWFFHGDDGKEDDFVANLQNLMQDANAKRGYRLVGDVNFNEASEKASYITPVPGGVGPMTIAMLLRNCVDGAKAAFEAESG